MSFFSTHLLSIAVFLPLLFAGLVAVLPSTERGQIRTVALVGMALTFAVTLVVYFRFDPASASEFQLEYRAPWIESLGVSYHLGVDGLAVSLMLLT
ncbi:MAG TPA: Fe-S-binding domain-containing protein, partial [Myxococcaceae bacterium]|nr:Fe-S-binding domain-containing protein [Myxococcaceae bacterium]